MSDDDDVVFIFDGVPYICGKPFPWASDVMVVDHGDVMKMRSFHLEFESGWVLSVIYGFGTHSSNYMAWQGEFHEDVAHVEIAAWCDAGGTGMIDWDDGDMIKGYVSARDLLALVNDMATWPTFVPKGFVGRIPTVPSELESGE